MGLNQTYNSCETALLRQAFTSTGATTTSKFTIAKDNFIIISSSNSHLSIRIQKHIVSIGSNDKITFRNEVDIVGIGICNGAVCSTNVEKIYIAIPSARISGRHGDSATADTANICSGINYDTRLKGSYLVLKGNYSVSEVLISSNKYEDDVKEAIASCLLTKVHRGCLQRAWGRNIQWS